MFLLLLLRAVLPACSASAGSIGDVPVTPERAWVQWEVLRDCVVGVDPSSVPSLCVLHLFLIEARRYLTLKTRITSTDSPEFYQDSVPPSARVGSESSLEWAPTFLGGVSGDTWQPPAACQWARQPHCRRIGSSCFVQEAP
jgi:hypothetical protein